MIAYLDIPSGISGDMFLGCLLDAGWPIDRLRAVAIALRLPPEEWEIDAHSVDKRGVRATLADVRAVEGVLNRRLADIVAMIESSTLDVPVKRRSINVFTRLAQAEARVHGTTIDQIHFHEVGAVDAIIDIVGVVAGLHELNIETLYASPVPLGHGWTKCAHGPIPLPSPATLELLAAAKAPVLPARGPGEWVTPTGAALLAELATFSTPRFSIDRIALGAGTKDCEWPNVARLYLGTPSRQTVMVQLETNIDDMNPQLYAVVSDKLFAAGAKDVWCTPIQMKKNRPAVMLSVLAEDADEEKLTDIILRETTTLGVRVHQLAQRREAQREMIQVETRYGSVAAKMKKIGDEVIGVMPEFDDCRKLAEEKKVSVREVQEEAMAVARQKLNPVK